MHVRSQARKMFIIFSIFDVLNDLAEELIKNGFICIFVEFIQTEICMYYCICTVL